MKKIKNYILSLLIIGSLLNSSCKKALNLEPKNSIDSENALITSSDIDAVRVGAYTAAGIEGLYGGRIFVSADFLGYSEDEIGFYGTYLGYREMASKTVSNNNLFAEEAWIAAYKTINSCNIVLENLAKLSPVIKNKVEGEVRFLRGMVYFDLARTYGKSWNDGNPSINLAVPIVLASVKTEKIGVAENLKRNTVSEVFLQAIDDLKKAKNLLPETNGFYANKFAASAVLSRIYLTQEDYTNAELETSYILDNSSYTLLGDFAQEWPNPEPASRVQPTNEDIFSIQVSSQAGVNSFNEEYAPSDFGGREDVEIQDAHFGLYEEGDVRANFFYSDVFTAKHLNLYGNVKLIRLAEIYLNSAEAKIKKSVADVAGALADLNKVRKRAGLGDFTSASPAAIFSAIKMERQVELAFEGFRLYDLKRYKESVDGIEWNSNKLVFPIPQREIDANPNLVQNPGYN